MEEQPKKNKVSAGKILLYVGIILLVGFAIYRTMVAEMLIRELRDQRGQQQDSGKDLAKQEPEKQAAEKAAADKMAQAKRDRAEVDRLIKKQCDSYQWEFEFLPQNVIENREGDEWTYYASRPVLFTGQRMGGHLDILVKKNRDGTFSVRSKYID